MRFIDKNEKNKTLFPITDHYSVIKCYNIIYLKILTTKLEKITNSLTAIFSCVSTIVTNVYRNFKWLKYSTFWQYIYDFTRVWSFQSVDVGEINIWQAEKKIQNICTQSKYYDIGILYFNVWSVSIYSFMYGLCN